MLTIDKLESSHDLQKWCSFHFYSISKICWALIQFKHKVVFLIISHVYTLSNKMVLFSINITIQYKQVLLYLPTPIFLFIFGMMLFKIACYLINFILIPTLQNTYSFELLFHTFPNYSFLWVFSYACFRTNL